MRLTNELRDAFIKAVMNDVPRINYQDQAEELLEQDCIEQLPAQVRAVWDDKVLRSFLYSQSRRVEGPARSWVYYATFHGIEAREPARKSAEALLRKSVQQAVRLDELRSKIKVVAYGCSTRKQLAEALPEFTKYLPVEQPKVDRTLPVLSGVIDEFKKAGWPKETTA